MTIQTINQQIQPQRDILLNHPLYRQIQNIDHLRHFMQGHVYAVWDFMSLLKALQTRLTCTDVPWITSSDPEIRYLINEIVLAEESDLTLDGKRLSHFEMYLGAMKVSGASTSEIERFLSQVASGKIFFEVIANSNLHPQIKEFLEFTFSTIEGGKPHEIAAAFTFGREDLIPGMFAAILKNIQANFPDTDLSQFIYYFERHIELDADEHGPMAMRMISELCGTDTQKWAEVALVSRRSLEKRIGLWDAIAETIQKTVIL
jgi:pyrroloquinoline quinone (PQQ) biosynthesis protein C